MPRPFSPGTRVQQLTRSCLVLTVVSDDGHMVTVEAGGLQQRIHAAMLTPYAPRPLPKMEPVEIDLAEMSAIDLLEFSRDGRITDAEYDAARREDDRRRAAMRQAAE